ncbi:MAG: hypothetical protein HUK24_09265 [Sphaerochaetaceae bacterium]|nr:hypothetical protein [Sphaerochaetaceae bacterium]
MNLSRGFPYEDIIDLPHHVSKKHVPMALIMRAAQFAPFSALTGYEESIEEAGRQTCEKIQLSEDSKNEINNSLKELASHWENTSVRMTYFVEDSKKEGGYYKTYNGKVSKITVDSKILYLNDGTGVSFDKIMALSF